MNDKIVKIDGEARIGLNNQDAVMIQNRLHEALDDALHKVWEDNPLSRNMVLGVIEGWKLDIIDKHWSE